MNLRAWARVSSSSALSKAGSPFRIPYRFSCSLLFRRQAVGRPVDDSRDSSSFFLLSSHQKFFHSVSFPALTALLIAFCIKTKAWGRSCHRTQEGEDEGQAYASCGVSSVFLSFIFHVLALYCMVARVVFVPLSSYTVAAASMTACSSISRRTEAGSCEVHMAETAAVTFSWTLRSSDPLLQPVPSRLVIWRCSRSHLWGCCGFAGSCPHRRRLGISRPTGRWSRYPERLIGESQST